MSDPMIFNKDEAFEQLKEEGVVFTVRNHDRGIGDVWIRRSRTGEKEFDAKIFLRIRLDGDEEVLERFRDESGFESLEDWKEAIKGEGKYLYGVRRPDSDRYVSAQKIQKLNPVYEEEVEKEIEVPWAGD